MSYTKKWRDQKLSFHYKRLSKKFTRKEKTKQKIRKEFEGYHVYIIVSAMFRYEICLIMKVCLEFYMKEKTNERMICVQMKDWSFSIMVFIKLYDCRIEERKVSIQQY